MHCACSLALLLPFLLCLPINLSPAQEVTVAPDTQQHPQHGPVFSSLSLNQVFAAEACEHRCPAPDWCKGALLFPG